MERGEGEIYGKGGREMYGKGGRGRRKGRGMRKITLRRKVGRTLSIYFE